jgi:hypothetical protein
LLVKIDNKNDYVLVGYDEIDGPLEIIKPELNVLKIINKHENDEPVNVHLVKPNYLKMIDAERNLEKQNDKKDN